MTTDESNEIVLEVFNRYRDLVCLPVVEGKQPIGLINRNIFLSQMSKQFLRRDPFECVLCGGTMVYRRAVAGLNVQGLKIHARDISLMRYIPA